ncbi:hypothetical protein [Cellulomonas telluris]|uniref:hypothetical protein n=1 Tax=Cellulomonas telluris TaxID=2306636 RepID=UPI001656F349|nr:hypothetical protein [Cellulomonas telluris]
MSETPSGLAVPASPDRENVARGTLAALLTLPVGVVAWVVLWGFGFIASIVAALVAFLALRLYVWGAGRISRAGAAVVLLTTAVTLALAFFAGIVYDAVVAFSDGSGLGAWGTLTHPDFWPVFSEVLPEALPEYLPDFGWALGFGALGSFAVLRSAFAAARAADAPADAAPADPAPADAAPAAAAPAAGIPAAAAPAAAIPAAPAPAAGVPAAPPAPRDQV